MLYDWSMESNYITGKWRCISQSEMRNSAAAESEGGQKFLPPTPLPFCPPERSVWRAKRAVSFVQRNLAQSLEYPTNTCFCASGRVKTIKGSDRKAVSNPLFLL